MTAEVIRAGITVTGTVTDAESSAKPVALRILSFLADSTRAWNDVLRVDPATLPTSADPELIEQPTIPVRASAAIAEMRRLSGLTWEQLADLFGVSRRALHFWASGKAQNADNEAHLQRALAVLRQIDRGSAVENRALLMRARPGPLAFDLLRDRRYDEVVQLVGPSTTPARPVAADVSAETRAARRPLPPEVLMDSLPDKPRPASGRLRGSFPIRKKMTGE